jgi:hypothetical protein
VGHIAQPTSIPSLHTQAVSPQEVQPSLDPSSTHASAWFAKRPVAKRARKVAFMVIVA